MNERIPTLLHHPADDGGGSEDAPVTISVSDSGLEAYATVRTPGPINRSSIINALQNAEVVTGYLDESIDKLIAEDGARGYPMLVAQGKSAGFGINANIELFFERNPKPKVIHDAEGNVDYKEVGVIQQVKEGDLLAIKTPPERGESGYTVRGKELQGRMGRDQNLLAGVGTRFHDEERTRLVAARSGAVSLHSGNEVQVSDQYVIDGDLDYAVGNIRFNGAVNVRGSVMAGFSIVATGDVEVAGVVEDAQIHCGGNLQIRGGFLGKGKGECRVVGNTHIRFLENQTLICNGDVHIAEEIVFGKVTCGGKLIVQYGKGAVIGGTISARKGIRAKIAGNIHHQTTRLIAGQDPVLLKRIDETELAISAKNPMKKLVQTAIDTLVKRKYEGTGEFDEEAAGALEYLYTAMGHLDAQLAEVTEFRDHFMMLQKELETQTSILVDQRVYPNVTLTIGDRSRKIDEETSRTEFRLVDGHIIGSGRRA